MTSPTVLSCIQPTGEIHLGNYLGAVRHWVAKQSATSFHGIVDLHALTVPQDGQALRQKTRRTAMILLAAGIDPDRTTLFVQSMIHEHAELGWMLECTISYGELARMTQFKDKASRGGTDGVSAGLFTYPALMAADILLYQTGLVPVGDDQRQHLELARDAAERFNSRYGEIFTIPRAAIPEVGARVMDLQDPTSKMSKSSTSPQGTILVLDHPDVISRKIRRAVTDSDGAVRYDPLSQPGVANLLNILSACSGEGPDTIASRVASYGALKSEVTDAVIGALSGLQRAYHDLESDVEYVDQILREGSLKAQGVAAQTLLSAKEAAGLWV